MRIIGLVVAITALVLVPVAAGDSVYHAQHVALTPTVTAESGSGFVENIHANGPNVFAHEQYFVRGALPLTSYDVLIHLFSPTDPTCSGTPLLEATTATFMTNAAGSGSAYHVFTPADAAAIRGLTVHVYWTLDKVLNTGAAGAYTTTCQTIELD